MSGLRSGARALALSRLASAAPDADDRLQPRLVLQALAADAKAEAEPLFSTRPIKVDLPEAARRIAALVGKPVPLVLARLRGAVMAGEIESTRSFRAGYLLPREELPLIADKHFR
jgi:hypothetical protein